jgi:Glycosyl hydrolases family 38 N-terminal domain/Alpha mannosidase middle domain
MSPHEGAAPITLVPHTHWDREWYLPFEGFLERLVPMMDGLLEQLDRGLPHFHLDGQTALIDDYLAVRPEREPDVRRHARAGRISVGPWFTLVDEFLVSGESIVRSLETGLRRGRELGASLGVGYLPDEFGHVGQMPQILAQAGIDKAVVWRGVPRRIDRTAFWWEAPDGSRVLAEYLAFGYSLGDAVARAPDAERVAAALGRAVGALDGMAARERLLVMLGGDHTVPNPDFRARLAAARELEPGLRAELGSLEGYLEHPAAAGLQLWRGELRSAARAHLLTGVYSTRAHQKRARAGAEALLERYAEPLAALVPGFAWPEQQLERAWRFLLWNAAHDSVCGCSADAVAQAVDARHGEVRAIGEAIVEEALGALGTQVAEAGWLRFNPSPFEREGVPGLGWQVGAGPPAEMPVGLDVRDGWIVAGGIEVAFTDEPDVGDLYTFCPAGDAAPSPPHRLASDGSSVTASFDGSELAMQVRRRRGELFLRLDGVIRNARPDHRLRLRVRLPRPARRTVAVSPFELVERERVSEGGIDEPASPIWPARGAVLAGGLAVLAEGVVEYELAGERELAITLLRCTGTISRARPLTTRRRPAGPDVATPEAQMLGETAFSLGLLPDATPGALLPAWERFALPLRTTRATGGGRLPARGSLLEVRGAALSSVRRQGDEIEVRVWNPLAERAEASVGEARLDLGPARIETIQL